jgi:Kef-type K+ transport system membrane component KefB
VAGLAPIVGAFTAGMILKNAHFERVAARERWALDEQLQPVAALLVPVFFVLMGLKVDLAALSSPGVAGFAAVLCVAAIAGKMVCGIGVMARGVDRVAVGLAMVPRGEVGLIFAGIGTTLMLGGRAVVTPAIYSGAVIMVLVTTVVAPLLLKRRLADAPELGPPESTATLAAVRARDAAGPS